MIGLSIAYALACEGLRPTVLDRRELGREASWAGAGLIPPIADRDSKTADGRACGPGARGSIPIWSAALREETGIDTGYRRTGGVDVAWTEGEERELLAAAGQWRAEGIAYERLPPGDYSRVEPALNPELQGGVLSARPGPGPQPEAAPGLDGGRIAARRPAGAVPRRARDLMSIAAGSRRVRTTRGISPLRHGGHGGRRVVGAVARAGRRARADAAAQGADRAPARRSSR